MNRFNKRGVFTIGLLIAVTLLQAQQTQPFDLLEIIAKNTDKKIVQDNSVHFDHQILHISPGEGNQGIVIWERGDKPDWNAGRYLVFEVYNQAQHSGVINVEFYKSDVTEDKIVLQGGAVVGDENESPWISCLIGVLPQLKTKVVFPLSYLDAQQLFLPRSPRQLKGTVSGNRLDPDDITKVVLRFGPYDGTNYEPAYELASVVVTDAQPEPYPAISDAIIDNLGQRIGLDWPGKLQGVEDLVEKSQTLETSLRVADFPSDWGRFGGWKQMQFEGTGFFRTHYDGNRWWLVDPDGYAFLSVGIDCIRANSGGPVDGIADLFEWLPDAADPMFGSAVTERGDRKDMDFYIANLIRVHGEDWREKWKEITVGLMKEFRVNTVGNWSDIQFARDSRIPYVLPLNGFPSTNVRLYRDFPDVFSREYEANAKQFAVQLETYKDDPYLVGYFLRNEPQWAFGYHNLAYEMFAANQQSATKNEFIKWIADRYEGDIIALNSQWKTSFADFNSLKEQIFKTYPSEIAKNDFHEFSAVMVKKYVDVPCDEVEKIDKNHLNLGMRYAWISSELLYKAGERFDVFSINGYGLKPPATAEIAARSGKPVMIGEFHQGAVDRALPATGIIGVLSQEERAAAYRNYIEEGFSRPELIGMHYFQWVDQPYYGRSDGENYNIGVVTSCNMPYPELTEAMTMTNQRIYNIATGQQEPVNMYVPKSPAIHY